MGMICSHKSGIIGGMLLPVLLSGCVTDSIEEPWSIGVGDRCPSFEVAMDDGTLLSTGMLEGKRSLIMFFDTGCADCRRGLPVVQEVYDIVKSGEAADVEFVCISRGEGEAEVGAYWRDNGLSLPYSAQSDAAVYHLFASSVVPRIYVVSADLVITASYSDYPLPDRFVLLSALGVGYVSD